MTSGCIAAFEKRINHAVIIQHAACAIYAASMTSLSAAFAAAAVTVQRVQLSVILKTHMPVQSHRHCVCVWVCHQTDGSVKLCM